MMKRWLTAAVLLGVSASGAAAQDAGAGAPCSRPEVPSGSRELCFAVAQAVESAQPQLGILIAGGNPTLGTASGGGLRMGLLPRVSASVKANVVLARIPDILEDQVGREEVTLPAPALSGTASVGIFPGVSLAPTVGGLGSVDLLGSVSWLPFNAVDVEGFGEETEDLAYGVGARFGILRESFTLPGVSVSVMYHKLGRVSYGDVCESPVISATDPSQGYELSAGACGGAGDPGEFAFDLINWSTRAAVSKRFLGLGATAGIGYDRYGSDIDFGLRTTCPVIGGPGCYVRVRELELDNDRLSAFANLSFTALVATFALEGGWLQGDDPIEGFNAAGSEFDPEGGTFFGSLGIRLAF